VEDQINDQLTSMGFVLLSWIKDSFSLATATPKLNLEHSSSQSAETSDTGEQKTAWVSFAMGL